ncbi:class I SAM-dependent methyltransferase [Echinicola salinicaeni]|uniref:class I SAM-dependent methyltransferase n=1 Tax=Echinicola salinicaeni TaxID=2762757 RepID=UPI0016450C5E|nr:class I SAM-dependent methyltransferase [Echinicola salinicaeni]
MIKWLIHQFKVRVKGINDPLEKRFQTIYNSNYWGSKESKSGVGSEIKVTSVILKEISRVINQYNITKVVDAPCGDFNWIRNLDFSKIEYLGLDIVKPLIEKLQIEYTSEKNIHFKYSNIIEDEIPNADLVICRDCLVHFSYADIENFIRGLRNSRTKYLLTTSFSNRLENNDIITGDWRPLNLMIAPFNFGEPVEVINEKYKGDNGRFIDKSMLLFDVSKLPESIIKSEDNNN